MSFRIVFMGTPDFAVPTLQALIDGPDEVVCVVTQPDRAKGRGKKVQPPPVKQLAAEAGIPVLQPERIKGKAGAGFRAALKSFRPDLAVVVAYGKILPPSVLTLPAFGCINVHASLLPRWRGAAPIQWAIAEGDAETGVSIMGLDEGMDTGPVYLQKRLPIGPEDTSATMHDKLSALGAEALLEVLDAARNGEAAAEPQPDEGIHAPMIQKADGELDFSRPAVVLERRLRAFTPWPGAFTFVDGKRLKVRRAQVVEGAGTVGTVVAAGPEGVDVACSEGVLRLLEVQPENSRAMDVGAWLAGHPLEPGARIGE